MTSATASGTPETSPITTSASTSATGSKRWPRWNSLQSLNPTRRAFSAAVSTAATETSHPMSLAAPRRAATKPSTPLPQPTSRTTSPGLISSASAITTVVWVGVNTPGPSTSVNGPVRPRHSYVENTGSEDTATSFPNGTERLGPDPVAEGGPLEPPGQLGCGSADRVGLDALAGEEVRLGDA